MLPRFSFVPCTHQPTNRRSSCGICSRYRIHRTFRISSFSSPAAYPGLHNRRDRQTAGGRIHSWQSSKQRQRSNGTQYWHTKHFKVFIIIYIWYTSKYGVPGIWYDTYIYHTSKSTTGCLCLLFTKTCFYLIIRDDGMMTPSRLLPGVPPSSKYSIVFYSDRHFLLDLDWLWSCGGVSVFFGSATCRLLTSIHVCHRKIDNTTTAVSSQVLLI